jgi:hypothetical protein
MLREATRDLAELGSQEFSRPVASGAMFGNSLYVNNARYYTFPEPDTEYWLTKLSIRDVQP